MEKKFNIQLYFFYTYLTYFIPNFLSAIILILYFYYFQMYKIIENTISNLVISIPIVIIAFIISAVFGIIKHIPVIILLKKYLNMELEAEKIDRLKYYILNMRYNAIIQTGAGWLFAGVVISLVLSFNGLSIKTILYIFSIIFIIGGSISVILTFYLNDFLNMLAIVKLFPDGNLSSIKRVKRIRIYIQLIIAFFISGVLPLLLYYFYSESYIFLIKNSFLSNNLDYKYKIFTLFILFLSISLTIISSIYFSKFIGQELIIIENAIKRVAKGDLGVRLTVYHKDEIGSVGDGFNNMVKALEESFIRQKELINIEKELDIAHQVQKNVLKGEILNFSRFDIDVKYLPYNKKVGGDYYNFELIGDDSLSLMIADATGHGIQAALSTMQIDIMNKQSLILGKPSERLEYINNFYLSFLKGTSLFTSFILNIFENHISFSSGGHPAQILYRGSKKEFVLLQSKGRVLGVEKDDIFENKEMAVEKNDILIFYTDGLFENCQEDGDVLGEDNLYSIIENIMEKDNFSTMKELNNLILEKIDLELVEDEYEDDLTLISIRVG